MEAWLGGEAVVEGPFVMEGVGNGSGSGLWVVGMGSGVALGALGMGACVGVGVACTGGDLGVGVDLGDGLGTLVAVGKWLGDLVAACVGGVDGWLGEGEVVAWGNLPAGTWWAGAAVGSSFTNGLCGKTSLKMRTTARETGGMLSTYFTSLGYGFPPPGMRIARSVCGGRAT